MAYVLNRFPLISLSFFVQGLMMSSEGETYVAWDCWLRSRRYVSIVPYLKNNRIKLKLPRGNICVLCKKIK